MDIVGKEKEAARLLGKSPQFVRMGIRSGTLPIGAAVKVSKRWSYYISAQKLREFIGGETVNQRR